MPLLNQSEVSTGEWLESSLKASSRQFKSGMLPHWVMFLSLVPSLRHCFENFGVFESQETGPSRSTPLIHEDQPLKVMIAPGSSMLSVPSPVTLG